MCANLIKAGYSLTVWNRSQPGIDTVVGYGAQAGSSPADVASKSDIIITMVTDSPDVQQVVLGPDGVIEGAKPGSVVIDMTTMSPSITRQIAQALAEKAVEMLDAPVSGGDVGAKAGTLSIMVGGKEEVFRRCLPVFQAMGKNIVHVGPSGAGQIAKACNQLVVAATIEAVAEALLLAERAGVDPARVRDALLGGFADSKILEVHGQRMLDRAFAPGFRIRLHRKDARIVQETAEVVGARIPSFEVVVEQLQRAIDAGDAEADHSALFAELAREAETSGGD
jgi:2-hydroxy-3-oxopropionate reductase